ncbi:MAG: TlpA disulfide reductase family protein [Desulfurivibrio sp.]|nr:TlpA disulfide reductase family protein [Desulfurivibrio sp.]
MLLALLCLPAACGEQQQLQLGDPAPDFQAVDQHGQPFKLSEQAGGPVVLRFWSVDCPYCRADTPVFNEYFRRYRDDGLMIVYVSRTDDEAMVADFIESLDIEFPVVMDPEDRIAELYRVKMDPMAVFIDPRQKLTNAVLGGVGEEELERLLGPYLP